MVEVLQSPKFVWIKDFWFWNTPALCTSLQPLTMTEYRTQRTWMSKQCSSLWLIKATIHSPMQGHLCCLPSQAPSMVRSSLHCSGSGSRTTSQWNSQTPATSIGRRQSSGVWRVFDPELESCRLLRSQAHRLDTASLSLFTATASPPPFTAHVCPMPPAVIHVPQGVLVACEGMS